MPTKCFKGLTGMNPVDFRRGVDLAVSALVNDLERRSKKAQSSEEIAGRNCTPTAGRKLVASSDLPSRRIVR
jgi:chaperonin GroEL (HSP60 family)